MVLAILPPKLFREEVNETFNPVCSTWVPYKAIINVIDFDNLKLHDPTVVYDLPAGGRRLTQKANGYDVTLAAGEIAFKNWESVGTLNGKLVGGEQPAPAS